MTVGNKKTAILLLTHVNNKIIDDEFSKLARECANNFDVFLLSDNTSGLFSKHAASENRFLFDANRLLDMGYPGKSAIDNLQRSEQGDHHHKRFNFDPGNVELPVLLFFREHPEYDRYWTIEYDVRFTGTWDTFFSSFETNDADLLGTTLTRYEQIPDWFHWPSLDLRGKPIDKDQYLRGFFPIYRLSRRALEQLDRDYRDGVNGHFECLVPTLLNHAGLTVEDIGGDGEFVLSGNRNRFYRNTPACSSLAPGTFVFRPAMVRPGNEPNTLWHPVKSIPPWRAGLRRFKQAMRQVANQLPTGRGAIAAAKTGTRAAEPRGKPIAGRRPGDR